MSKVFVNIGLSLDGYMAPEGMTLENWDRPEHKSWGAKWGALMRWIMSQQYFRFVNDGPERALASSRESAGGRDASALCPPVRAG